MDVLQEYENYQKKYQIFVVVVEMNENLMGEVK